jgi:hypothetical protein
VRVISLLSPKTRLRLFSEPGSGKSELGYETAIFFDGRNASRDGTNRLLWESFRRNRDIGQQNDTGPDHTSRAGGNNIKAAKSFFNEPREKLSPRPLASETISRILKDFVAKVYN